MLRCRECGTFLHRKSTSAAAMTDPATDLLLHRAEERIVAGCKECSNQIKARREFSGMRVKCPHCGTPVRIPSRRGQEAGVKNGVTDPSALERSGSPPPAERTSPDTNRSLQRSAPAPSEETLRKPDETDVRQSLRSTKNVEKDRAPKAHRGGRRFSLWDLVPSLLLGLFESLKHNRKTSRVVLVGATASAAACVWFLMNGLAGGASGPVIRGTVVSLSLSSDGRFVAAGRNRGLLEIWDVESQQVAGISVDMPTQFVAFGPENKSLFAIQGTRVATTQIDGGSAGEVTEITQLGKGVIDFSVNHERTFGVSLSADQLIYRWNLSSPKAEAPLQSTQTMMAVAISSDGTQVAGATEQGALVIWSFDTGEIVAETQAAVQGGVTAIAFQQHGRLIAAATGNGELILWDPESGRPPRINKSSVSGVSAMEFPPGGEVVVCRRSGEVERWKVDDDTLTTFKVNLDIVTAMSLNSGRVAVGSEEMTEIVLFNLSTGTAEQTLDE
jgi:WD40 repeat protein